MSLTRSPRAFLLAAIASSVLAACGGGGSGGSDTAAAAPAVTPVISVDGTIVATPSAATYTAGTVKAQAFDALNAARKAAGAGVLSQSAALDVATAAHAAYIEGNMEFVHDENPAKPFFYAVTPKDRAAKAGYAGTVVETLGGTGASHNGADCALGLLNTVYHGEALLVGGYTDVGIASHLDSASTPACVINLGRPSGYGQIPASGAIIGYPGNGMTVEGTFYAGYETPRPPIALFPSLTAGTPVIVSLRNADYINLQSSAKLDAKVTEFTLKDSLGNVVAAHILAGSDVAAGTGVVLNSDPLLFTGTLILVPKAPLPAGTYTATVSATLGGTAAAIAKTFSFTAK